MYIMLYNENDYQQVVVEDNSSCILDFWATWCSGCKSVSKYMDSIESSNKGIKIIKMNIEEIEPELADKYNVRNLPTVVYLKDGHEVACLRGARKKEEYEEKARLLL